MKCKFCTFILLQSRPGGPHPIPPQQAVLILRKPRERHEQYPFFWPPRLGSNGEYLGG
jgi:hypothetical protein